MKLLDPKKGDLIPFVRISIAEGKISSGDYDDIMFIAYPSDMKHLYVKFTHPRWQQDEVVQMSLEDIVREALSFIEKSRSE